MVLIGAGGPIGIPGGQDQTSPFRVHPDYRWLTGRDVAGGILAFDPHDGWADFVPEVTEPERVWEGRESIDEPGTRPLGEMYEWLEGRRNSRFAGLGVPPPGTTFDRDRSQRLGEWLLHARRVKDALELAILRRAVAATARGFEVAREMTRAGSTERLVQIELEAAMFRAGADDVGYGTLVGSGPNASVLHFSPSTREIRDGELVLVDAGGMIGGYTADVTRTFTAGERRGQRSELYDVVLDAQVRAIEQCRAGVQWRSIHTSTATDLARGLVAMGVLRGSPETLVEREAIALFFPHGVGHMVGLGVRDAGGRLPGTQAGGKCCGVTLRVDLPLASGYLMTVEPGIYFIAALLRDPVRRERFADCVDWTVVDRLLGIGGVRIEDNILITDGAPEVLTAAIPK